MRTLPTSSFLTRSVPADGGDARRLEEGDVLGRFVVVKTLGEGSGGVVYAAWDSHLGRRVALKVFDGRGADADKGWRRLIHEAQLIARLDHPNVVTVHDIGALDGKAFIAMELVDGRDLAAIMNDEWERSPRPAWRERVAPLLLAGEGLAAAHAAQVIHGDFKPANVLVGHDGRVKVSDFGIGVMSDALSDGTDQMNATGGDHDSVSGATTLGDDLWGTPLYMAPELFQGLKPTVASDVYSFCASLYQALYGEPPAKGNGLMGLYSAKLDPRPGPSDACVPNKLRDLVLRGLDPNPSRRPPSIAKIVSTIRKLRRRRGRRSIVAGGTLAVLGAAAVAWGFADTQQPCADATGGLEGVWDSGRRRDVETAFRAVDLPHAEHELGRVVEQLDHYARQWSSARVETCQLTRHGEQSTLLEHRKMACLAERRGELDAFVKVLVRADTDTVREAPGAAQRLSSITSCRDRSAFLDAPLPGAAAVVDRIRVDLASARGLRLAGRPGEAAALIDAAVEEAATVEYASLQAEALRERGHNKRVRGLYDEAEASLTEAVWVAEGAKADGVAARASLDVLQLLTSGLGQPKRALSWAPHVEVALRRAQLGPTEHAEFFLARSHAEADLFEFDAAAADLDAAEAQLKLITDDPMLLRAALANARSLLLTAQGKHVDAALQLEGVVDAYEEAHGRMHPDVARALDNTAGTYVAAGDYARALELYDEAAAIAVETLGPDHPTTLMTMANRAGVFVETEQYDDAIDQYHEVLEADIRVLGAEHPQTATMYLNLAGVLGMAERFDEAAEAATKGRLILEAEFGPEHGWVAYALINEGSARLERGEHELAVALLERANAILTDLGGQPEKLASAQYALARALVRNGTDRGRAIDLMKRALDNYRSQNIDRPEIQAELDALTRTGE